MFIRQKFRTNNGKRHAYWALVESYRTERGPRQRIVSWLGKLDEQGRIGVGQSASQVNKGSHHRPRPKHVQLSLLEETQPRFVKVDPQAVRVENCKQFGAPWLAITLIQKLQLDELFAKLMPSGREAVPWSVTAMLLVIARFC